MGAAGRKMRAFHCAVFAFAVALDFSCSGWLIALA
jgi:hypothetical protein